MTSFDVKVVQNVKFPRDVNKDRSGTCLDLAILFASMANALGLTPFLVVKEGHCFPAVAMPGDRGDIVGVETTLIGGGIRFGSGSFRRALQIGGVELEKVLQSGKYVLLPIIDLWAHDVYNPELEELPADILMRWGITETGAPGTKLDPFAGTWTGNLTQDVEGGGSVTYPFAVVIEAGADLDTSDEYLATSRAKANVPGEKGSVAVEVVQNFTGIVDDGTLHLIGASKIVTMGEGGKPTEASADSIVVRVVEGRLEGKIGSERDGWTPLSLRSK